MHKEKEKETDKLTIGVTFGCMKNNLTSRVLSPPKVIFLRALERTERLLYPKVLYECGQICTN